MQITEHGEQDIISELWSIDHEIGHTRSPGLHVSKIIYTELEEQGQSRVNSTFNNSDLEAFRALGFLWERIIVDVIKRQERRLGTMIPSPELCMDNVYMTPDYSLVKKLVKTEEYKCTTKSARMQIEEKPEWLTQIQCYCRGLGTLEANLRVLHLRGYINPPIPKVKQYHLSFTQSELDETWLRLLNFAKAKGWL